MNLKQILDEAQAKGRDSAIFKVGRGSRRLVKNRIAIVPGLFALVLAETDTELTVALSLADAEKYARNLQKQLDKTSQC